METKELDKAIVAFLENNTTAVLVAFIAITLFQMLWWVTRKPKSLLTMEMFHDLPLIMKKDVNHNTRFFRFGFEDSRQELGLPIGQHVVFRFQSESDDEPVSRKYTPISDNKTVGYVDFIIKIYPKGVMTQYLDQLKIGDRLEMKGPKGKFKYRRNMKKTIGMLAGGTGITPMYQVLNHILQDSNDRTEISLIYANITASDILLRQNLDSLAAKHPTRFNVYYVIEKNVPLGWKYGIGYITQNLIVEHCEPPSPDTLLLCCGPRPMVEAMKILSENIGYAPECTFKF